MSKKDEYIYGIINDYRVSIDDAKILPSKTDKEIINIVKKRVKSINYYNKPFFNRSTSYRSFEIAKDNIKKHYGKEVYDRLINLFEVEKSVDVNLQGTVDGYFPRYGSFNAYLSVNKNASEISNIHVSHELIHTLLLESADERQLELLYGEVLSMFEEHTLALDNNDKRFRNSIISERILNLKEESIRLDNNPNVSILDIKEGLTDDVIMYPNVESDILECKDSRVNKYFLSYYYTVLLIDLYNKYPNELKENIKEVLLNNKTTKDLLYRFELLGNVDKDSFISANENILKKCI